MIGNCELCTKHSENLCYWQGKKICPDCQESKGSFLSSMARAIDNVIEVSKRLPKGAIGEVFGYD